MAAFDASDDDDLPLDLSAEAIEDAYARALEAVAAAEVVIPQFERTLTVDVQDEPSEPLGGDEADAAPLEVARGEESEAPGHRSMAFDAPTSMNGTMLSDVLHPRQVLEAVLFVGGVPLTPKRLSHVFGREMSIADIDELVEELNSQYNNESRPYEVLFREGAYELALRGELGAVRDRVYGRNPKEVKLSQDALEVLALVAYRQPVGCPELVEAGKTNAPAILRQLLARQLIQLHRGESKNDVTYSTTPRFLELFGLRSLDELPLPEDFALK